MIVLGVMLAIWGASAGFVEVTVICTDPVLPSDVPVIVTVPAVRPVTSPALDTDATAGSLVDQSTGRPVSVLPLASRVTAVTCVVVPVCRMDWAAVTVTVAAGGGTTETICVPVFPSTLAVIVAVPGATPATTPLLLTVAMVALEVDHAIVRFASGFPSASRGVAVSCVVCPTTRFPGAETSTVATAGGPEESPPHAIVNASATTGRANLVRIMGIDSCKGEAWVPRGAAGRT